MCDLESTVRSIQVGVRERDRSRCHKRVCNGYFNWRLV